MKPKSFLNINTTLLLFVLLFAACSKKDPVSTVTKTTLITASAWKFDNAIIDQNGDGTSDFPIPPGVLLTCSTDDMITFKSDKTGIIDEGATKCDASDPQTAPFGWELINNETEINFTTAIFVGVGGVVKIIELNATKFRLSKQVDIAGVPLPLNVVVSLKH